MGTTLVQFQSCSVCGCLELQPVFVTAKAALNSDRMKVSCSMVSPCYIIIMFIDLKTEGFHGTLQTLSDGSPAIDVSSTYIHMHNVHYT